MEKKLIQNITDVINFSKSARDVEKLSLEIFIGICAIISSLYIFIRLTRRVLSNEITLFDSNIIQTVHDMHSPFLTQVMKIITFLGGEIFMSFAVIATILLLIRKHKKDALVFGFLLVFGLILNLLLKGVFQRARPDLFALVTETTYSFPSGHSMNATVFFLSLTYFIFRNTRNKKLGIALSIFSGIMVLLIGFSRVYLGVHFPSDVIGGFAAGTLLFVAVLFFEKSLIFFKLFKQYELNKKY